MKNNIKIGIVWGLVFIVSIYFANAQSKDINVAKVFQSHMVLQQKKPITIWGTSKPGKLIYASLGDEELTTVGDEKGNWLVTFPKREASFEPLKLKINDIVLEDILIGEVWICSGQSNLVRPLVEADGGMDAFEKSNKNAIRIYQNKYPRIIAKNGYSDEELDRMNVNDYFEAIWEKASTETIESFSAVSWEFGNIIARETKVPVGLMLFAVGGSAINNWISPKTLKTNSLTASYFTKDWLTNDDVHVGHWVRCKHAFQRVLEPNKPYIIGKTKYRWMCEPGFLFEAGIQSLQKLKFQGVLWYQGESDASTENLAERYKVLFPLMVSDWRAFFNQGNFPFIYIQLPRYNHDNWPEFRNIQRLAKEKIPNSYMVVTIDLGLEDNIHPTDKLPIGKRAGDIALDKIYGFQIEGTSLEVKRIKTKNNIYEIKFSEDIVVKGNRLNIPGFEIVISSGEIYDVIAKFKNKRTIIVERKGEGKTIRYGWQPYPKPDLIIFSNNGSPLSPFKLCL